MNISIMLGKMVQNSSICCASIMNRLYRFVFMLYSIRYITAIVTVIRIIIAWS